MPILVLQAAFRQADPHVGVFTSEAKARQAFADLVLEQGGAPDMSPRTDALSWMDEEGNSIVVRTVTVDAAPRPIY